MFTSALQHQPAPKPCSQILEEAVKTKWNILPEDQRKGIRQVLSDLIIQVATAADSAKNRVYLHKLNVVLVQVCATVWQVLIAQLMKSRLSSGVMAA